MGRAAPPTWDHIVVVIEENKSFSQVLGSGQAPFIDALAAGGASLTNMYGITHPSQPNYLHLFSGANQGVTTNNDTSGLTPFNTPNLGAALIAAGRSFGGYSENLPAVGYTGFEADGGLYSRRHNPWVQWQAADAPSGNHLPASVNMPFSAFPTTELGFANLPTVSFVVPNNLNNMHDGTIAQGDTWLQNNLGSYAAWAAENNSLLIVTFDEDNSGSRNRIPTVFYGANVAAGAEVQGTWTLHDLLHTVEASYGLSHVGASADTNSIVGAFTTDPEVATRTFQQGQKGYFGSTSNWIEPGNPNTTHGSDPKLVVDGSPLSQGLIRFDDLFGSGDGQIPHGATILSAKLLVDTGSASGDETANTISIHRLLVPFTNTSTWNSLVSGISLGTEALSTPDFTLLPNQRDHWAIFDVTDSLRNFSTGASNYGWLLQPGGGDGWRPFGTQGTIPPILSVTFVVPEPATWLLAVLGLLPLAILRKCGRRPV